MAYLLSQTGMGMEKESRKDDRTSALDVVTIYFVVCQPHCTLTIYMPNTQERCPDSQDNNKNVTYNNSNVTPNPFLSKEHARNGSAYEYNSLYHCNRFMLSRLRLDYKYLR